MIELLTAATPNGYKAAIALEEMDLEFNYRKIKLGQLEQKEEWYLALNPNGRIPVIIDHDNDDFVVFESGAILIYLAEKTGKLIPDTPKDRSRVLQWLMFQMGGLGPMMGQSNVFYRYAEEKIPYAIDRYHREVRRLLEVLDGRLADREFLVGDYSTFDTGVCDCGRTHVRAVGAFAGRSDDLINLRGIKMYPVQLEQAVRAVPGIGDEYEIVLSKNDEGLDIMTARVEHDDAEAAEQVASEIRSRCEIRADVELLTPGTLPKTEFKAKRVRDER